MLSNQVVAIEIEIDKGILSRHADNFAHDLRFGRHGYTE